MQINLLWQSREYPSIENCIVTITERACEVSSVIVGVSEQKIFKVEYNIKTNHHWQTTFVEIKSRIENTIQTFCYHGDGKGKWQTNGKTLEQFNGCIDVDIPLTPFTNTLPINRLKLKKDQEQQIKVIYLDLLNEEIKPVTQKYTRLSDTQYKYENIPNDFEAAITVDESGLVVDYPTLFERISKRENII